MNKSHPRSRLFILSAPSGAGKTTLCDFLLKTFSQQLVLSVSTTTRKPRGKEQNGVEYFFVSEATFREKIQQGDFAEWAEVHGHFYGTSRSTLADALDQGKHVLLDIDVQGAASLRKAFPQECVLIFVTPPSLEELERRLRLRQTDPEAVIQQRLRNAEREMARASEFDYHVVNDRLEEAQRKLLEIFESELK